MERGRSQLPVSWRKETDLRSPLRVGSAPSGRQMEQEGERRKGEGWTPSFSWTLLGERCKKLYVCPTEEGDFGLQHQQLIDPNSGGREGSHPRITRIRHQLTPSQFEVTALNLEGTRSLVEISNLREHCTAISSCCILNDVWLR